MCDYHDFSIMTGLWFIVHCEYILEYTASNNSLYRLEKTAEKCASLFLALCMYVSRKMEYHSGYIRSFQGAG